MGKLKLQPDPTFKRKVAISVPGGRDEHVEFIFTHRDRTDLQAFMERVRGVEIDAAIVMEMACGWDLTDAFNAENVALLLANYITAPLAIYDAYLEEHVKGAAKN